LKNREAAKSGSKLAGFTVLAELGRGAASIIYLVQDPRTKQIWALKHVVKETPKDQRFLEQAEKEYEISTRLDHPALRKIPRLVKNRKLLSVKELFLVMEYIDGISIEKHPPETFDQALAIAHDVAEGLAHMHEKGFVHADMKPNNIVVTDDGVVKVIDLGQSCPMGTIKERIQGTPDYIAPEQVHRREITPKTDIYNLGATLYWILTNKHIPTALPKGDSLVSSLDDQFIEKPKPLNQLNPRVPDRLNDLVMRCVEVSPEDRPESMRDVAEGLDLIRAQLASSASGARTEAAVAAKDDDD
jgi:serine/threonine-protein kinase